MSRVTYSLKINPDGALAVTITDPDGFQSGLFARVARWALDPDFPNAPTTARQPPHTGGAVRGRRPYSVGEIGPEVALPKGAYASRRSWRDAASILSGGPIPNRVEASFAFPPGEPEIASGRWSHHWVDGVGNGWSAFGSGDNPFDREEPTFDEEEIAAARANTDDRVRDCACHRCVTRRAARGAIPMPPSSAAAFGVIDALNVWGREIKASPSTPLLDLFAATTTSAPGVRPLERTLAKAAPVWAALHRYASAVSAPEGTDLIALFRKWVEAPDSTTHPGAQWFEGQGHREEEEIARLFRRFEEGAGLAISG